VVQHRVSCGVVLYIKMENVTRAFVRPCVMDVKVGPVTYDHEADAAKVAREKAKSPSLSQVGFQIVGVRVRADHNTLHIALMNVTTSQLLVLPSYFRVDVFGKNNGLVILHM